MNGIISGTDATDKKRIFKRLPARSGAFCTSSLHRPPGGGEESRRFDGSSPISPDRSGSEAHRETIRR